MVAHRPPIVATLTDTDMAVDPTPSGSSLATERDVAANRRDAAADRRDLAADRRDQAADLRDRADDRRDQAGERRDQAAEQRDDAAEQRDDAAQRSETAGEAGATLAGIDRSALARRDAAADRRGAQRDRRAGASERLQAEVDRSSALADRGSGAAERTQAERDRNTAWVDRDASAAEREAASVDGLTGVHLRGAGSLALEREIAGARRAQRPLVLAYVDVDHLKATNDSQGHASGDRLLSKVATTLRSRLRSYDLIIRYGGDEFVCAMSGLSLASASTRLERVNTALALAPGHGSVTIGLAELRANESMLELIARADAALYAHRREQRGP